MSTKPIIAPSILAADFGNIQKEVELLNESQADWIHLDVMDGEFVPNISFGIPVCNAINKHSKKPLDVHLMIIKPERYVAEFAKYGAEIITVHAEACPHLHRNIQQIKALGCKVGVSLNPHTPVEVLKHLIKDIDLVLIMSVNPGFGGQKFIGATYAKIKEMKAMIDMEGAHAIIEVDGGVTSENARQLVDAGASALVAGSFVFKSDDPKQTIADLKNC